MNNNFNEKLARVEARNWLGEQLVLGTISPDKLNIDSDLFRFVQLSYFDPITRKYIPFQNMIRCTR